LQPIIDPTQTPSSTRDGSQASDFAIALLFGGVVAVAAVMVGALVIFRRKR
jgi:hypothetical protein